MRQVAIMYNNILALLDAIYNNANNEVFATGLVSPKEDRFVDLLEALKAEIDALKDARDSESLYANYDVLEKVLVEFGLEFPTYNISGYHEINIIIRISKIISDQVPDLTDTSIIDTSQWELVSIDPALKLPQEFYSYYNSTFIEDSLIYFTLSEYSELESGLRSVTMQLKLIFILLSKIGEVANPLVGDRYIFLKQGQSAFTSRISAFLQLHLVADGKTIHVPKTYMNVPVNNWKDQIKVENKYQQFDEIFHVISEYNHNKDVLNKYLKIYQVIEEYMYKSQLVKFERQMGGRIFSLRDFKRMNEEVAEKESAALSNFMSSVFLINVRPGHTFKDFCLSQWKILVPAILSAIDVESVLSLYRINKGANPLLHRNVGKNEMQRVFCALIYGIRNSIVHNKSTEFHLTYKTLSNEIALIIENFLFPCLELIVMRLTIDPTSEIVWFSNTQLKIWEDN